MKINVVESIVWKNEKTGQTASCFGAAPGPGFDLLSIGWTWRCVDRSGQVTTGLGRQPVATREEAEAIADKVRALHGSRQ